MEPIKISYTANRTLKRFHRSNALVRGVRGPRASGKSTAMCIESIRRGFEQRPGPNGIRYVRGGIVRNTYPELRDTTLKTWMNWFPEEKFGKFNHHDMVHKIVAHGVEGEFLFRALDRPGDIKKLLSLELTFAWINEAREVPRGIVNGLLDAIGRYPALKDGGPTWHGLMMDTNSPDTDHWWYKLAEEKTPEGWEFFNQPGALVEIDGKFLPNPEAENLDNILGGIDYYTSRAAGATPDHNRVYYCNLYGFVQEGKPVYPEYFDNLHCPGEVFKPAPGLPIYIGLDFGLTPAALFAQRLANGRWVWFDELVTEDLGIDRFSQLLTPKLNDYQGFTISIYGDPSGSIRAPTDERTCYQILEARGIKAQEAPSNVFTLRREAVASCLRRIIDGKPGLLISPKCIVARKAMAGGYHFRRIQIPHEERYQDEPYKNKYSHVAEAGQYAMLGAGEGDVLTKFEVPHLLKGYNSGRSLRHGEHGWML